MTMHLMQGITTTRTKPQKRKITKTQMAKFREDHRLYNKRMKQQGRHDERMSFDDYVNYCFGKVKTKAVSTTFTHFSEPKTYRRETPYIPSLGDGVGNGLLVEPQKYTGTLVTGIATMHKSNAVPVINQEQATDIAKMRRN